MRLTTTVFGITAILAIGPSASAQWTPLKSGTAASLRGLSVVSSSVVWASGTRGTVVHTTDGGASWSVSTLVGAERLDLRAIHGRSAQVAHVAATAGRIWRTQDGGRSWDLTYQASDTTVFLDAIDFWDDRRGMAVGDPMRGHFLVLLTNDGGATWQEAPASASPPAMDGEAAFAASGSSLILTTDGRAYLGSGGTTARLHRSIDWGKSWQVAPTPVIQGSAARGIFSVTAPSRGALVLVGGDYEKPDTTRANAAYSLDAVNFTLNPSAPRGYRSGVAAFVPRNARSAVLIAVGPTGSDISRDHGKTWTAFDSLGFHAVRAASNGVFFASGSEGRIATFDAKTLK